MERSKLSRPLAKCRFLRSSTTKSPYTSDRTPRECAESYVHSTLARSQILYEHSVLKGMTWLAEQSSSTWQAGTNSAFDTKLQIFEVITLHLRMSGSRTCINHAILYKIVFRVLIGKMHSDKFIILIYPAELHFVLTTPRRYEC